MILRFAVSNYKSIKTEQALVFTASALDDDFVDTIDSRYASKYGVLPALAIYGPNASGKSSVINALASMQRMVLYSHSFGNPNERLRRSYFLLDPEWKAKPTKLEIDFVLNDIHYNYGFEFNSDVIISEWLYSFPNKIPRLLFIREGDDVGFGRSLKGKNKFIDEIKRPNSLLLAAGAQNNHELLSDISSYFSSILIETAQSISSHTTANSLKRERNWKISQPVIDFLNELGTGISNYRVKSTKIPDDVLEQQKEFQSALKNFFKNTSENLRFDEDSEIEEIELAHKNYKNENIYFSLSQESSGTIRLLHILPNIFDALNRGSLVLVDELDLSLHTKAAELVFALFSNKETNPNGAQLVATTHDTNLLSSKVLRRDQVWFVEKLDTGETELFPLSDIKTRKGDNLERAYLEGRYGALPNVDFLEVFS